MRTDGNDEALIELAAQNALAIGAGHSFIVFLDGGFPVSVLNAVKAVPEVRIQDLLQQGPLLLACMPRRTRVQACASACVCGCLERNTHAPRVPPVVAARQVCRIHCATANPVSIILAKTSDEAKVGTECIGGLACASRERLALRHRICTRSPAARRMKPPHVSARAQGVIGVIDGLVPTALEDDEDKKQRHEFLRSIGYKR